MTTKKAIDDSCGTYTPRAGDVIESANGRKRIRVHSGDAPMNVYVINYRRKWFFSGPWTVSYLFGFQRETSYKLENLVDDHGWKLVKRREP